VTEFFAFLMGLLGGLGLVLVVVAIVSEANDEDRPNRKYDGKDKP
jgi:hypothetical protein